jgi:hypothetical protein
LHMIVDAPWFVPNIDIQRDLRIPRMNEESCPYSSEYSASLSTHPNVPVVNLMQQPNKNRRLQKHLPSDVYQLLM